MSTLEGKWENEKVRVGRSPALIPRRDLVFKNKGSFIHWGGFQIMILAGSRGSPTSAFDKEHGKEGGVFLWGSILSIPCLVAKGLPQPT